MGNVFKVEKGKFVLTPIKTRVDAILNTPTPQTAKELPQFVLSKLAEIVSPNL